MKKRTSFLFIIVLCPLLYGCVTESCFDLFPPLHRDCIINNMSMCFSNDTLKNTERVRTDGFYYYPKKHERTIADTIYKYDSENPWGSEIYRLVFFIDGMFGGDVWFEEGICRAGEWGLYEVHKDTIIIECVTHGSMNGSSYGFRDSLLIKSHDTLVLLSRSPICPEFGHENYLGTIDVMAQNKFIYLPC